MGKKGGHGILCFCGKCTGTSGNKRKTGSKPVRLGGADNFPRRDTGGTPARRQDQKNHGTNRRGGGQQR